MSEGSRRPDEAFLEVDPHGAPAPSAPATDASGAAPPQPDPWLERVDPGAADGPIRARKKVRAEDRAPQASTADATSALVVAALQADHPLAAALWPDVKPGDLLRTPPPPEAFAARCDWALRAIDAVARKDDESRARAVVAQRALENKIARASAGGASARDSALAELDAAQIREIVELAHLLGGARKEIAAGNLARLDEAAAERGVEAQRARASVRAAGYSLLEAEARGWSAFEALPGAPNTMDAVALSMLQNPVQAAEAVRSGAVLAWLRENHAAPEVVSRARDARMAIERAGSGASEALAVHTQAWAFGRRELVAGGSWLRAPGEIAVAVRAGSLSLDALAGSARDGVLAAWLRMHGWMAASGAADLVARAQESGMKRLAWSLGEPLVLGDSSFVDPATLSRTVLTNTSLRESLVAAHASGDLLAWLESLPPALRDEQWIERLRRGREAHGGDQMPLWMGVYAQARAGALEVRAAAGHPVSLTSPAQLKITTLVAEVWDDLKRAYRTGELQAWLALSTPLDFKGIPRPPTDEDAELNALLWTLGHSGMVLEWGPNDFSVSSPSDLVRAFQTGWQQVESQLARGYVLAWLERFHGDRPVGPVKTRDLCACLRAELGRLPAGYGALKLALICGLRYLPADPSLPGDSANFRGYSGVAQGVGDPLAWEPLHEHLAQGTALLWLAQQPSVREADAREMLSHAFFETTPRAMEPAMRRAARLAAPYGVPMPSATLAAEIKGAVSARGRGPAAKSEQDAWSFRPGRTLVLTSLLLALGASGALWQHLNEQPLVIDASLVEDAGRNASVSIDVNAKVPATDRGESWDFDQSPPDLSVYLVGPGGPRRLGLCHNRTECVIHETAALEPRRAFEVVVRENDPWGETEVCRARISWTAGRDESVHTEPGVCDLRLRIRRTDATSAAVRPPTPARRDAGALDAGVARDGAVIPRRPGRRPAGLHKLDESDAPQE